MTRWYRAYVGTVNDPKLAGVAHRAKASKCEVIAIWHFILERAAEANAKGVYKMDGHQICATLDLSMETVKSVWAALIEVEMVTETEVLAWKKRQYETDAIDPTNAQRQKRWKEKHLGNGKITETKRPDTDTDTDTERKKDCASRKVEFEKEKGFLDFYSAYPKKKSKKDALKAYIAARKEASHEAIMAGLSAARRDWNDHKFIPYPASWLRSGGWEDESQKPKITNGFAAVPGSPEFNAWKAFLSYTGQSALIRVLNQREIEGRAFDFQSQWPPGEKNELV